MNPAPDAPAAALTRGQKFSIVLKVIESRLWFVALMAATGLIFGYWDTIRNSYEKWARPPGALGTAASPGVEFFCPMHPTVVQAEPGGCPVCGMPLAKRRVGKTPRVAAGVVSRVALGPLRVAQAGIRTDEVGYAPLSETVTEVGSVTFNERRLARISSRTKGLARVETLAVNFNGTELKAGDPLAVLSSPELFQAVRELLLAQKTAAERASRPQSATSRALFGDVGVGAGVDMVGLAREKLSLWGITPAQVDEILAKGNAETRLAILSPIGGVVVRMNVAAGST